MQTNPVTIRIKNILNEAWTLVNGSKAIYWSGISITIALFILIVMITTGLSIFYAWSPDFTKYFGTLIGGVWTLVAFFPITLGLCYIAIERAAQRPVKLHMVNIAYPILWEVLGPAVLTQLIIYGVLFTFGFLVGTLYSLIDYTLPSIEDLVVHIESPLLILNELIVFFIKLYFSLCFCFAPLLMIIKKLTVFQAMAHSFIRVNQHLWKLLIIVFVSLLLMLASLIPLGLGLIWFLPFSLNLTGILYRDLFENNK